MADGPGPQLGPLRPSYPVRTERLLLRPLTTADADALHVYRGRDDVSRYVPFEPMSRDDILERIAGQWARTELTDEGQWLTLGAQSTSRCSPRSGTGWRAGRLLACA